MIQDQKNFLILPPLTSGKLHGYLTMSVDEVLWNQNFPGNVSVECQWWGDQQMIKFRPANILQATSTKNTEIKKIFHIKTTLALFEKYLINCDTLKLLVINEDKKETIGYVYVKGLHKIVTELQYQSYFPILDSYRNRIGDLHIVFSLYLKKENEESTTNSFKTVEKDPVVRVKMKKGCDTCFKDKKLYKESNNNPKLSIPEITVPPNTQRTEYSDVIVSEILSKGQQLRNAMVMSVLEDCNIMDSGSSINVLNFNLFPHHDSQNKPSSNTIDLPKSPVKYHEKIVDFLLGKDMTEEEELKTLETFRSTSPSHSLIELLEIQNKVDAELEEPLKNDQSITCGSNSTYEDQQCIRNETTEPIHILPPVFNKLNCFRLTIKNLILTDLGQKKIKPSEKKRNLTKFKEVKIQPVTTYFIECHKDQDVINQNYPWKSKTGRFCSRRQIDNIVFFGQSTVHSVTTPFTLATLRSTLNRLTWLVFWKHFSQRSPSLLGKINFDSILLVRDLETVCTLPVETVDGVSGNVEILLELGENKKTFGNIVLEKSAMISSHKINMKKTDKEEGKFIDTKRTCIDIIKEKNKYDLSESNYLENIPLNIRDTEDNSHCIMCRALLEKCEVKSQMRPIVCTQCQTHFNLFPKSVNYLLQNQSLCTSQPPSLMTHEIMLTIENINNFPLFLINDDDIRCYVDYKFFNIDESGIVGISQETHTSKVLFCENTVNFDSYQTYELNMPLKMSLASCLSSYKPGLTFHIWQRYFKPSPRDHMVAMAYLPTIKLAMMESKFNELSTKQPILEKIKLPLVLVPSSVTIPYQNHSNFGTLEISISYRNYLFFEPKEIEHLNSNQEATSWGELGVQENTEVKSTDSLTKVFKNCGKTILKNKEKENKLTQTEIEDEVQSTKSNNYEENFKFMRRCFWTGETKK
uniref:C2CD3 N-terminal C2 domain-containing protein n=1 Tax=Clastoptera arizonana TaxID=38151 RepID=A0A1B6E377_9HEMI